MSNSTMRSQSRLIVAAAGIILGVLTGSAAMAAATGGVTITGTRYVDGVQYKVRCMAAEGNEIFYASGATLHLIGTTPCGIYNDTDDADNFHFDGANSWIVKNGVSTDASLWNATQQANGPYGSDPAHGTMGGVERYVNTTIVSDKGTISYWRIDSLNRAIIFVGKYKVSNLITF
jgi:hypothetical protein